MRIAVTFMVLLAFTACGDDEPSGVGTNELTPPPAAQARTTPGVPQGGGNGLGTRPLSGTGTAGNLTAWTGGNVLGDAPIRVADNGDLIVQPGTAIILTSADGTQCWRLSGEGFQKLTPNCPAY